MPVLHTKGLLSLARLVATTEYENAGFIGVMRRVSTRIERIPLTDAFYYSVVGVIEHQDRTIPGDGCTDAPQPVL